MQLFFSFFLKGKCENNRARISGSLLPSVSDRRQVRNLSRPDTLHFSQIKTGLNLSTENNFLELKRSN